MDPKNYSYINNMDDLKNEINIVKLRIQNNRLQLQERWQNLPATLIRKATGSLPVPFLAKKAWTLAKSGLGAVRNVTVKNKANKIKLFAVAGFIGFAAYKGFAAYRAFKKKNNVSRVKIIT